MVLMLSPHARRMASLLARAFRWHGIWPGGFCGVWSKRAGMRPVACGPHGLPPAPMLTSKASRGSDARHWFLDVILGFAEYALSFPIYIYLPFSLSLLFRRSLLYDSPFNIFIRTRLISTLSMMARAFTLLSAAS
jgi:hypothetical protein